MKLREAAEQTIVEHLERRRLMAGDYSWVATAGSSLTDVGQAITADGSHVYLVGTFKNTVDFDPSGATANLTSAGGADVFIAKYTHDGVLDWARRTGGTGDDIAGGIAVDGSGNVYANGAFRNTADFDPNAGTFNLASAGANDAFVWKLTSSGALSWAVRAGAAGDDAGRGIKVDTSGNVFTTGHFSNTIDFDPSAGASNLASSGSTDAFLWKLTSSGAMGFARKFGATGADVGYDLALDAGGNVFATGDFSNTVDFDPGAGTANLISAGGKDIYLVKLDASGNHLMSVRMGGAGTDTGLGIAMDSAGSIFTTGLYTATADFDPGPAAVNLPVAGEKDIFLSKLDAAGNFVYVRTFGSAFDDDAHDVILNEQGEVYIGGSYSGTIDFDPSAAVSNLTSVGARDFFLVKFTNSGNLIYARGSGSTGGEYVKNLALDPVGGVYATGHFAAAIDFDPGPGVQTRNNTGWSDIFLLKLTDPAAPTQPPNAPTGIFAAPVSHTRIDFSWQDVTGEISYRIERSVNGTSDWQEIATVNGNVTSVQDNSLNPQTEYFYRVFAVNSAGSSQPSGVTSTTTPAAPPVLPNISIVATDSTASEPGTNTGLFTVTRTGDTSQALVINYTISGSAINGTDYQSLTGSVTIPANSSSAMIDILPTDDLFVESIEYVTLTLSAGSYNIVSGSGSAAVSITDDEPVPPPPPAGEPGLTGDYFDNQDLTDLRLTRIDPTVNFNWAKNSPDPLVGPDTFSVRWTGFVQAQFTQNYRFYVDANNGVRLWVNDVLIIDRWTETWGEVSGTINMQAGVKVPIKLEFFDYDNNANAKLSWSSPSRSKQVIPQANLFTTGSTEPTNTAPSISITSPSGGASFSSGSSITINSNADDNDGVVAKVEFFANGVKVGEDLDGDWSFNWQNPAAGGYALTAVATDDDGATATSATVNVTVLPPPGATPSVSIVAHDDIVTESSDANPFVVTRSASDINQPLTVFYTIGGSAADGQDYGALTGSVVIPAGQTSASILVQPIDDNLVESEESVELTLSDNAAYNIGAPVSATMRLLDNEPAPTQPPFNATQTPWLVTNRIEAEDFDNGGAGVAYNDTDTVNAGGRYRTNTAVDIQAANDTGGGFLVGWTRTGEWLEYTINVPTSGIYDLVMRVASSGTAGTFRMDVDGVDVTDQMTAGNTGGTQSWRTITRSGVQLTGGTHVLRLVMIANGPNGGLGNFNWFQFNLIQPVPPITLSTTDANAAEQGSDPGVFTISRGSASSGNLTVFYTVSGGTASGLDYGALTGSVVIPDGQNSATITITPADDLLIEGSESLIVTLSSNQAYALVAGSTSGTITIADNDQAQIPNTRPNTPVLSEPTPAGVVVAAEAVQMEILPFSDPDPNDVHTMADWEIWTVGPNPERVWADLGETDPVSRVHGRLGDGVFMGSHAGRATLLYDTDYEVRMRVRDGSGDAATEWSEYATGLFRTNVEQPPLPDAPDWLVLQPGYKVEMLPVTFATGEGEFRLPVNIAFVPNPGPNANDPLFYVTELYGTIRVVTRDYTVHTYATGLLNYNPMGPISGSGEQGLSGIVVDPATGDVFASMLYDDLTDGTTNTFGKIVRFHSTNGGLSASSSVDILKMPGETQAQSHFTSNLSIGPDGKLWAHNGDGFFSATALNLDSFRGKILRMNLNGTAAADNPFHDAANGITARDYVYAYGMRNPFGGAWRESDGSHYSIENGPSSNDRLTKIVAGGNYGWDGTASSMLTNAIYTWSQTTAPVNGAFIQPGTFGGSGFPTGKWDHLFVTESGATYASGPQSRGKAIVEFTLDASGNVLSDPTTLARYSGNGKGTAVGLAAGPDGLYFTDLYEDDPINGSFIPTAAGANILRIRYVGV